MRAAGRVHWYTAAVFCLALGTTAAAQYSGGSGEADDPYQIATVADLIALGETTEDYDRHFVLTADIDLDPNLPGRKVFERAVIAPDVDPVRFDFQGPSFTGVFDGNGYVISNLTIAGGDFLGLFGQLGSSARVSNLGLETVEVNGSGSCVGSLVGDNFTYEGGIVASHSTGSVRGAGSVGGLVGYNAGSITMSYSASSVNGTSATGGLVGTNFASITTSYSTGAVSGGSYAGGLAGSNDGNITASYATGPVHGTETVGGLVGHNFDTVAASYSSGDVRADSYTGGLVGYNRGRIVASYASSPVTGTQSAGGLVGGDYEGRVSLSFWDIQTSGQPSSAGGTGLTTAEMQDTVTFHGAGWDFADNVLDGTCDYWQMRPGEYPRLYYHAGNLPLMPEGLGTAEQPYLIRDGRDLGVVWFEPLAYYRQAESVDLSGMMWSMAVVPWFRGSFDGNGYVISHLHIEGHSDLGLFGLLRSWSVSNLGLEDVEISGTSDNIGSLAGTNLLGVITSSYSSGSVSGTGSVGGLVGYNAGSIAGSYSGASVDGNSSVGGLVGQNGSSIATSCSNSSVNGDSSVGGLVGYNRGNVATSYSGGSVTGSSNVGGLVGYNRGRVATSYSRGPVGGTAHVGGLVGYQRSSRVMSSFWDTQTSGQFRSAGGRAKTTAEMQTTSTFLDAGWDFVGETINGAEDIWWILEGLDYPRLWWEAQE